MSVNACILVLELAGQISPAVNRILLLIGLSLNSIDDSEEFLAKTLTENPFHFQNYRSGRQVLTFGYRPWFCG